MKSRRCTVTFALALSSALLLATLLLSSSLPARAAAPNHSGPVEGRDANANTRLLSAEEMLAVAQWGAAPASPVIRAPLQGPPDLEIVKWNTPGHARPGGVVNYVVYYHNHGESLAENTFITDTLPAFTAYASDNSGLLSTQQGNMILWEVGNVPPQEGFGFIVTLNVDAAAPVDTPLGSNGVTIHSSTPEDNYANNSAYSDPVEVWADEVEIGVDVWVNPGDPTPGHEFVYDIQICNHRGAAAGPVWLTDTIPVDTSVVGWHHDNPGAVGWEYLSDTPPNAFVLTTAGFPGNFCDTIHLRLLLDGAAPQGANLHNHVIVTVADDVDPGNNEHLHTEAVVSPPRYDVGLDAWFAHGSLTPGGMLRYGVYQWNHGNVAAQTWLTVTLPPSTTYQAGSTQRHGGQGFEPSLITAEYIVWDLGQAPVQQGFGFDFSLDIDAAVAPGARQTCLSIGGNLPDSNPDDNTRCIEVAIFESGPNLAVSKEHWWNSESQLGYRIHFYNLGDVSIPSVWITDTLPTDTTWDGWRQINFPLERVSNEILNSGMLAWELDSLDPGEYGNIEFNVNLSQPVPLRWYTNTVEITLPDGDVNPADNVSQDVAFSGGEVQSVDFNVGESRVWGCAYAEPVIVTTANAEMVFWNNCWDEWNFPDTFEPGDTITVTAGAGLQPVVVQVPAPFTAEAASATGIVQGQIGGAADAQVEVHLWGFGSQWVLADGAGHYSATFSNFPRGGQGEVNYRAEIDYADVTFHRRFQSPDLNLMINYAHDWVEGNYEAGHTVWITVTDGDGNFKASAEMFTGEVPWWGGQTGFSTSDGDPWQPARPDIQPGDLVHGAVSNGYTATVQLAAITGFVDVDTDSITGTVNVPWLPPVPIDVECHTWGAPEWAPNKHTTVIPNGSDIYTCAWTSAEWDIQPGQQIGVMYREPAGHQVFGGFSAPVWDLILNINYDHDWVEGNYEAGHTVWITVTDSGGVEKATAEMPTGEIPWWGGNSGFSTNLNNPWMPQHPNIEPGDFVHGTVSTGYAATVEIGLITGFVDADANMITGTINAPWLPGSVEVDCQTWGSPGWAPNQHTTVIPNGNDIYTCAWTPEEWDIQPGQDIAVFYHEPEGQHQVGSVFSAPVYDLRFDINYGNGNGIEGRYALGHTIWLTVTDSLGNVKGSTVVQTEYVEPWNDSGFMWGPEFTIQPYDWVYGTTDSGYSGAVQVGHITGFTDLAANSITGTIQAPGLSDYVNVWCDPWIWPNWAPGQSTEVYPDGYSVYTCAWDPETEWLLEPGRDIGVRYRTPDGHHITRGFRVMDYDLRLTVNADADWISGPYAPGYTLWLTVTNASDFFKASFELYTDDWGFYVETDIEPGDHLYGLVENGRAAAMRVGEITGFLDVESNTITGTISAGWLYPDPGSVDVDCYAWEAPDIIPHQYAAIAPDDISVYTCAWASGEWDIRPGQTVAVAYYEPGGHQVVRLFTEPVEPPVYTADSIVVVKEPSAYDALLRLATGDLDIYAGQVRAPDLVQQIVDSPDLEGYRAYGSYNELTFNPAGPIFAGTGKLNPFAVPRVREAMNWLLDRDYIAQVIMGGMAVPRWHALNTASPDYADLAAVARALELHYAYNQDLASQVIAQEMLKLGATRMEGQWYYAGQPVEIILLIRTEDERTPIGDYVGDQLEEIGFTVNRQYKSSGEASPIWISGDPADGRFHIYTGGWITTQVPRDLSDNFAFFYTDMGLDVPLWQAYQNTPEFYALAQQLNNREFADLETRRALMAHALNLALKDSVRVWLFDTLSLTPRRTEVSYASDLYGGIAGSWMWAQTLQRTGEFTTPLTIGAPELLSQPWNPLNGSGWLYDGMVYRATGEPGLMPDPFTGLNLPQRIESATVIAQAGLPIAQTHAWVDLQFAPSIVIPDSAWAGWDAATQQFLTAAAVYGGPQTAHLKSVVVYPADLTSSVTWHDGSPFSIADIVMHIILNFDRELTNVKAVEILSTEPLIIATYTDEYQLDAENNVITWWPYYNSGPGAWHNLALGLLVEAAGEGAFAEWQANENGIPWLDYVTWPGMLPLENKLGTAIELTYIPYAQTLGTYLGDGEAEIRWTNLANWHSTHGHFWIGTGPLYLDQAYPSLSKLALRPYPDYPDAPDRWAGYTTAPIAEVAITGPTSVPKGVAAAFDVAVTFQGQPYLTADIKAVRYLLLDAQGNLAFTGAATAVAGMEGRWRVVLTSAMTQQLPPGPTKLVVFVNPKLVAVSSLATHAFQTTGLRVLSVTPNGSLNTAATPIVIIGRLFQNGATVDLVRNDSVEPLVATYVDANTLNATVPAGLLPGTYGLRVTNPVPDEQQDTLLSGFTVHAPAAPVITAISPQRGSRNLAIAVDIYGYNFAPGLYAELNSGLAYPLESLYFVSGSHIRAVVPAHIPAGLYTLTVMNPNGQFAQLPAAYEALEVMDDLSPRANSFWLNPLMLRKGEPVTPTMGIAVRRTGGVDILPGVDVDFYYQAAGGTLLPIGRAHAPLLEPYSQTLTIPLPWPNLPPAGVYTLHAIIDPDNVIPETVETNNTITRTVIILPPLADTIPPFVESLRINDGEQFTTHRQVYLNTTAQDNPGGTGVASLLYVEYVFVESLGYWRPIASSGWQPYADIAVNHPWSLHPVPGVHYIRAWAADASGNISERASTRFINLLPTTTPAPIAADEAHTYRVRMVAGEELTFQLTTIEGDADIYVWAPDGSSIVFSDSATETVESVSFIAETAGVYQIEVYGYAQGSYTLEIVENGTRQVAGVYGIQQSKGRGLPTSDPGISPESDEEVYGVPSLPADALLLPAFAVSKVYESSRVAGMPITYTLTVTNTGNVTGTDVVLSDHLPIEFLYANSDGNYAAGIVTWDPVTLTAQGGVMHGWINGLLVCTLDEVNNAEYGVTSAQGISATGLPVSFTIESPTLHAAFTHAPNIGTILIGETITFTDQSTTNGPEIFQWAWDFGDGVTSTVQHPTHTYTETGVYTVTLTIMDTCGFTDTVTTVISVLPEGSRQIYLPLVTRNFPTP